MPSGSEKGQVVLELPGFLRLKEGMRKGARSMVRCDWVALGSIGRACGVIAAMIVGLVPVTASAQFHENSIGQDSGSRSGNNYYSGVSVVRTDGEYTLTTNSSCLATGPPNFNQVPWVAQAEWVTLTSDESNWVEFGANHKTCPDGSDVFIEYGIVGINGNEYLVYTGGPYYSPQPSHRYFLANGAGAQDTSCVHGQGGCWEWWIDSTEVARYFWPNIGFIAQTGLESTDSQANTHGPTLDSGMVKTVDWSNWQNWNPSAVTDRPCLNDSDSDEGTLWCITSTLLSGSYSDNSDGYSSQP